jgi:hypothetical protein
LAAATIFVAWGVFQEAESRPIWFAVALIALALNLGLSAVARLRGKARLLGVAHLCFALAAACAAWSQGAGFRAKVLVEEGGRVDHAEALTPGDRVRWPPYQRDGRRFEGLLAMPFEL